MGMFDNFNNIPSDNRIEFLNMHKDYCGYIIPGSTNIHYFKLPFNYNEVDDIVIKYEQLSRLILIKNKIDLELLENDIENNCCLLSCTLKPEDTIQFKNTLIDTQVQIKITHNNNITLSKVFKIKVNNSLEELKNEKK